MTTNSDFNFDLWAGLAKDDPEAFETERKAFIEKFLADLPAEQQQRLMKLQWRVDMERQRSKTPMESAVRIYDMMWDSVSRTYDELQNLADMLDPNSDYVPSDSHSAKAKVLQFSREKTTAAG